MGEAISGAAATAAVRVLAVSRVAPAPTLAKHAGDYVKLSYFDALWVVLPPVQLFFLYKLPRAHDFSVVVKRLKESLAATLALYLPLAGRLTYLAEKGDLVVDCSNAGVVFVEAEGDLDVHRLARDEAHDIPAFRSLVPELDTRVLPSPVLSVQATRLSTGMAVGVSVHHTATDAQGLWRFLDAWASASRDGSPVTKSLGPPRYGREAIVHPRGDEFTREMLTKVAPNIPVANMTTYDFSRRFQLARRTFYLSADDIRSLKRHIDGLAAGAGEIESLKPVSRFVALSALGWTAFVWCKGLAAGDDTHLIFLADLRARLDPPIGDDYLGNCVCGCLASADTGDLLGEVGLLHAARAIQEAAPPGEIETRLDRAGQLPDTRFVNVAGSPRFQIYQATDFGFGRPDRMEHVSMNRDGEMMLFGGRCNGEVQLSVSLDPARMDAFKARILAALQACRVTLQQQNDGQEYTVEGIGERPRAGSDLTWRPRL